jgi:hypothetical protein
VVQRDNATEPHGKGGKPGARKGGKESTKRKGDGRGGKKKRKGKKEDVDAAIKKSRKVRRGGGLPLCESRVLSYYAAGCVESYTSD